MSRPQVISEISTKGAYSTTSFAVPTSVPAMAANRWACQVGVVLEDDTTDEIYYSAIVAVTKYDATNLGLSLVNVRYVKNNLTWLIATIPQVTLDASIISDELHLDFTVPSGFDLQCTYRIEGVET